MDAPPAERTEAIETFNHLQALRECHRERCDRCSSGAACELASGCETALEWMWRQCQYLGIGLADLYAGAPA